MWVRSDMLHEVVNLLPGEEESKVMEMVCYILSSMHWWGIKLGLSIITTLQQGRLWIWVRSDMFHELHDSREWQVT